MEKIKEVINKVTHKDQATHDTTHTAHTAGTHSTGTHHTVGTSSGLTGNHSGMTGSHGTAGPHDSNLLNKADPRVDSDMDGGRNMGATTYGPGATTGSGLTGTHHTSTTGTGLTSGSTTAGPHSSNLLNKVDPRVDSDMDGSRNMGATTYGSGTTTGSGLTGTHHTGTTGTGYSSGSTTAGPHSSNLLNKMDPRVDSDMDGSRNMGAASNTGFGNTSSGTGYGSSNTGLGSTSSGLGHGTHNTVTGAGSGLSGSHAYGVGGLDGPAPNTAGPHKSDMLNKVDPRVDSDRDGSKTIGGNPQY